MPQPTKASAGVSPARTLVQALARALDARLIETHISWVLLTRDFAYKIKKPVTLPFVDYGTLAARQRFCEEELRLNRRLAPSLYLNVARITGSADQPVLDGEGPAIEYAVRMRRFADGALFSERLAAGLLEMPDVDALATLLANFHQQAPQAAPGSGFGDAQHRQDSALAALAGSLGVATPDESAGLAHWLQTQALALRNLWSARQQEGRVRECHGDLHLANLVWLDGQVAAFDGIEFNPALRWIDILDDLAFPVMDFAAHGRTDCAYRLLNGWLDLTGEHAALPALRFAAVYRALVRTQVERLRGTTPGTAAARDYLAAALAWTRPPPARLFITHGLPGSGKTFESQRLLQQYGAIRLRSDVERKRLHGLGMLSDSRAQGLDLYTAAVTRETYQHLLDTARIALRAGYPVILDAAFLRHQERAQAHALARELGVGYSIVVCEAPMAVLRERLLARRGDASEANVQVLERLHTAAEPLAPQELAHVHGNGPLNGY